MHVDQSPIIMGHPGLDKDKTLVAERATQINGSLLLVFNYDVERKTGFLILQIYLIYCNSMCNIM